MYGAYRSVIFRKMIPIRVKKMKKSLNDNKKSLPYTPRGIAAIIAACSPQDCTLFSLSGLGLPLTNATPPHLRVKRCFITGCYPLLTSYNRLLTRPQTLITPGPGIEPHQNRHVVESCEVDSSFLKHRFTMFKL